MNLNLFSRSGEEGDDARVHETKWAEITRKLLEEICGPAGLQTLGFRLWDGSGWPDDAPRPAVCVFNRPSALRELLSAGSELGAGEAFIRGAFDLKGDPIAAFELADLLAEKTLGWTRKLDVAALLSHLPAHAGKEDHALEAKTNGKKHSIQRDQEAIRFHYDVSNAFYSLWLDPQMVYSCAYFESPEDSLETAQMRKLDIICRKLDLQPNDRFLDIGCGWGALLVHAARNYGVHAEGVTLSEKQFEYVARLIEREGLQDRIKVHLRDYRDLPGTEVYNKISSVGMVEHVGTSNLPSYFQKAATLLAPGGLFLNHGIGLGPHLRRNEGEGFIQHYVFPDSDLQPVDEMLRAASGAQLEIRDVESLREHYAKTLSQWIQRMAEHRDEVVREVGEQVYRIWRIYMAGSAHGFRRGHLSIYQTLLAKPDDQGNLKMPMSRRAWYSKAHASELPRGEGV